MGGNFQGANSIGGQARNFIARLDATTGLADSFNPNASAGSFDRGPGGWQNLVAAVFFGNDTIGRQSRNRICPARSATGLADSFDPNANDNVYSIALQADGKILVAGMFAGIGLRTRNYMPGLIPRPAWLIRSTQTEHSVDAIAVQADGKILVGGAFINLGGQAPITWPGLIPPRDC